MGDHIVQAPYTHVEAQAAFTEALNDGEPIVRVIFPAGTHVWTGSVVAAAPSTCVEYHVMGMGAQTQFGGTDQTIIQDNWASSSWLLQIGNLTNKVRIHDFRLAVGPNYQYKNEWIYLFGYTNNFRIYNFSCRPGDDATPADVGNVFLPFGYFAGVIDHCYLRFAGRGGLFHPRNTTPDIDGHYWFAQPTPYGGEMLYCEDNFVGSYWDCAVEDGESGAAWCVRFNSLTQTAMQTHPTAHLANRGNRHAEVYCNQVSAIQSGHGTMFGFMDMSSATLIIWNNPISISGYGYKHFMHIHAKRRDMQTYGNTALPEGWGFSGKEANFMAGHVNTNGTDVTLLDGNLWSGFNPSTHQGWTLPAGAILVINGLQYFVDHLVDETHCVLTTSAGIQNNVMSYPLNNCDGNTDIYGYPNIDQPGWGQSDLYSGSHPSMVNASRSNVNYTDANFTAHQKREPIYMWDNPFTAYPGSGGEGIMIANYNSEVIQENRDYFTAQDQNGVTKAFTNTSGGVGKGTFAQMQSYTPTIEYTGFWVTDRGTWNAGTNPIYTGQGQLWQYVGGQWRFLYEPKAYPHPLIAADNGTTPIVPTPTEPAFLLGTCLT